MFTGKSGIQVSLRIEHHYPFSKISIFAKKGMQQITQTLEKHTQNTTHHPYPLF